MDSLRRSITASNSVLQELINNGSYRVNGQMSDDELREEFDRISIKAREEEIENLTEEKIKPLIETKIISSKQELIFFIREKSIDRIYTFIYCLRNYGISLSILRRFIEGLNNNTFYQEDLLNNITFLTKFSDVFSTPQNFNDFLRDNHVTPKEFIEDCLKLKYYLRKLSRIISNRT